METEPHDSAAPRAKGAAGLTLILLVAGMLAVFALPNPEPRRYPERIPVRFWHMWTAEWKGVVDRIAARFNESQDVYEVIPLSVPGTAADSKFLLAVAGGDPPDVMAQWNPVIPKWAESGLLMKLNEMMTPEEWETFQRETYPAVQKVGIYKGDLYGVTTGLNAMACFIRLDHLRDAGLRMEDFPDSLEGLMMWGEKLNRFSAAGELTRIGFLPMWLYFFAPGFNGGFYDWDTGEALIDTPENLAALTFLAEARRQLGFQEVVRFQAGLALGIGNIDWPFITGSYSIFVDGQWRVEQIAQYAPNLEYATAPIPPPEGGKPLFGWTNGNFMIIPVGARCPEGAWEFIKFWSGIVEPARAAEFYTWGGWLPLSPAIAEAPVYQKYVAEHPQFQTFLDMLPSENMHPLPPVPYQVYLFDRILSADDAAMRGALTPQAALGRLNQEIMREVDSRREFGYED